MGILLSGQKYTSHCMKEWSLSVILNNITLFYKTDPLQVLLLYRDIYQCPKCDKVILEEPETADI